jgi:hypothetical protein
MEKISPVPFFPYINHTPVDRFDDPGFRFASWVENVSGEIFIISLLNTG